MNAINPQKQYLLCFPHCWTFVWGINLLPVDSTHKGLVMRGLYVFFGVALNKLVGTQSSYGSFERPSRPCDITVMAQPVLN